MRHLKSLYESHRWFQLRDSLEPVGRSKSGSVFPTCLVCKAAVAYAFHDFASAERNANEIVRSNPVARDAHEARDLLLNVYRMQGRYQEVFSEVQALRAERDGNVDFRGVMALFSVASQLPRQDVMQRGFSKLRWASRNGQVCVPVSVNGRPAQYSIDTGADLSAVSAAEAERLGLAIHPLPGFHAQDLSGVGFDAAVAMADELKSGEYRFRNVLFLVPIRGNSPSACESGGGIIGLNVLLGFERFQWDSDGTF